MQKGLFVKEIGKPIVLGNRPIPSPKEGQVLIKITATMILPHDTYGRDLGLFIGHKLPYILGTNLAGIIQSFGSSTTPNRYPVGSHIFGQANVNYPSPDQAGLQQYAVLDISATAPVPAALTDDQVVTLPVNAVTSFIALFHPTSGFGIPAPFLFEEEDKNSSRSDAAAQITIVVIGAGTNVGKLAVQFAKLAGVAGIIGVASISRSHELRQLGATHVIDRNLPVAEIAAQVHAAAGGAQNLTRVYDCASWKFELAVLLLPVETPSVFLALHPIDGEAGEAMREARLMCETRFVAGVSRGLGDMEERFWRELPGWAEKGAVGCSEVRVVSGLDEEEINLGLDGYRDGSGGKGFVVHPNA